MERVFIGHDPREEDAYEVCVRSLTSLSSVELDVRPVSMVGLRAANLYRRKTIRDAAGVLWDECDGRRTPMSTTFSLARFFVPFLCGFRGWAMFVDCDFLFRADVAQLFALRDDRYAVMVVKHCYCPRIGPKMDGMPNEPYERKNWSSLVLWNCGHPANAALGLDFLNSSPPSVLHGFRWLEDNLIGALPFEWNWLALEPRAVHFTYGVPTMPGYENEPYADEWVAHYHEIYGSGRARQADTQADTEG